MGTARKGGGGGVKARQVGVGDIIEKIIDSRYIDIFKTYRQIIVNEKNRFWNYRKIMLSKMCI